MISELEKFQGLVLRQILVSHSGSPLRVGVADLSGRTDAFSVERGAFQVKHSAKRLSPWQFTYAQENLLELGVLRTTFDVVWVFLVCGTDGVVGLSVDELFSIADMRGAGAAWVRISRSRNSMYRVAGSKGELDYAKPRGVHSFLDALRLPR